MVPKVTLEMLAEMLASTGSGDHGTKLEEEA